MTPPVGDTLVFVHVSESRRAGGVYGRETTFCTITSQLTGAKIHVCLYCGIRMCQRCAVLENL